MTWSDWIDSYYNDFGDHDGLVGGGNGWFNIHALGHVAWCNNETGVSKNWAVHEYSTSGRTVQPTDEICSGMYYKAG